MVFTENGTLTKPVYILCLHKSESHYEIVPKTERRYRFEKGQPYLVKYEEDIEYFKNHISFVEQGKAIVSKEINKLNEKIADKVQDVIEEEVKSVEEVEKEEVEEEGIIEDEEIIPDGIIPNDSDIVITTYTKSEIKKMNKSEQINLIQTYKDNNLCQENIPIRENGRVDLILKLQGDN
jgi:hypothetical protein